jgi:ABC-2 type transport system permease protein
MLNLFRGLLIYFLKRGLSMIQRIKEIYKSRELLKNLTSKELQLKYKNSTLGFLWSFLNPIMMMFVYTFAFNIILGVNEPNYQIFILAGILPWMAFQGAVQVGTQSIVNNASLIKKVYFPREIIPLSIVFSNFINYIITLTVLFAGIFLSGMKVGLPLISLPIVIILFAILTCGLTLLLSSLNALFRDVSHFIEVIFMAWMYLTPIIYKMERIPEAIRPLMYLNPMALVINSLRAPLYENRFPDMWQLGALTVVAFVFLFIGFKVFNKLQKRFAEEI